MGMEGIGKAKSIAAHIYPKAIVAPPTGFVTDIINPEIVRLSSIPSALRRLIDIACKEDD